MATRNPFKGSVSLRTPKPAAAASKAPIALKETGAGDATGVGIVKGIRLGDQWDGMTVGRAKAKLANVTVQFGEDPPAISAEKRKKMDYEEREALRPPTSTFDVPPHMAAGLSIGDRVRVSIEKLS
jgi:hypothetical protein